jgi:hypothetical protein
MTVRAADDYAAISKRLAEIKSEKDAAVSNPSSGSARPATDQAIAECEDCRFDHTPCTGACWFF